MVDTGADISCINVEWFKKTWRWVDVRQLDVVVRGAGGKEIRYYGYVELAVLIPGIQGELKGNLNKRIQQQRIYTYLLHIHIKEYSFTGKRAKIVRLLAHWQQCWHQQKLIVMTHAYMLLTRKLLILI